MNRSSNRVVGLDRIALAALVFAAALAFNAQAQGPSPAPGSAVQPPASTVTGGTFAVIYSTGPKWDKSKAPNLQEGFVEHSANLRKLREAGVLHAGARYGEVGLMIVRAENVDAASALFANDPTIAAGVFRIEVTPFFTVYSGELKRELNPKR